MKIGRVVMRGVAKLKDWSYATRGKWNKIYLKLTLAECGTHLIVNGSPMIYGMENIHVGNHVTINNGVQICPRGKIYIGDYVTMSRGSQITAGGLDMSTWADEGYKRREHSQADVYIGEGAWLCVNSTVLPGVKITGKGVVVAAGAVVTKDIDEDYVLVAGVPAKIVKHFRKEETK